MIDKFLKSIANSEMKRLESAKAVMEKNITKLDALSPLKTLTRGYSITTIKSTNKVVKDIKDVKNGDEIEIRVNNGVINATVD